MALLSVINRDFERKPARKAARGVNLIGINAVREISFSVKIGGATIPKFLKWKKELSAYSPGSTCSVEIPILQLQSFVKPELNRLLDVMELSQKVAPLTLDIATTIVIGEEVMFNDTNEFSGIIDTLTLNRNTGVYTVQARSYAQVLLNAKTNDVLKSPAAQRKTTTEAVKLLVKEHGMGLKAIVGDFKTPIGNIFKEHGTVDSRNVPVWDLLQSFAQADGADLFVQGDTLYYVKPPTVKNPDITELKGVTPNYIYDWEQNILDLEVVHSPMFAHDITVTVNSIQTRTGEKTTATKTMSNAQVNEMALKLEQDRSKVEVMNLKSVAKLKGKRAPQRTSSDRVTSAKIRTKGNYTFTIPNASTEDCDRIALRIMEDISKKEFIVKMKVLGQPDFNPRQIIGLLNSGSKPADQDYAIKSITTEFEMPQKEGQSPGYTTEFMLVNHYVQSVGVQA